ncbi:MAG: sulfotransferase [Desulfobacteraceae bacterium]|jgi:hypothetical protein
MTQLNKQPYEVSTSEPKPCFILGILKRSGTNYIYRLLREHPDCIGPGPIWEDYFVHFSDALRQFANNVYSYWSPRWEVAKRIGPQEKLMRFLGDAICRFLKLQLAVNKLNENESKILLTKAPSVRGSDYFFDFFPDCYLIVIIRDGRAVVESGVRSFGWNYEQTMQRWKAGAQTILRLKEKCKNSNHKLLIIRYEDLFLDEKKELLKIFDVLGLDPEKYSFESTASLGVTGSSDIRKQNDSVHWQVTKKAKDFDPLSRFKNWDKKRHERFNWIAGSLMAEFGYDIKQVTSNRFLYVARNWLMDIKGIFKKTLKRYIR